MKYNRYALTLLFSFMSFCFINRASAQIAVSADPVTCADTAVTLHGTVTGMVPTSAGITADDGYSSAINIGFTFNYYGNNYTQVCIGSNGVITMGSGSAGAYCTWPISNTLSGTVASGTMRNTFCTLWSDICTPCFTPGGTISYSTIGTAPYRKFVVTWCAVHMFGCTSQWETFQGILYETTNICESHIGHRTYVGCTWNGPYAIVGVGNSTGTASTVAPGRDYPLNWGATGEAWSFTPSSPTPSSYTVSSIPYAPIPYSSSTVYWYDSATGVYVGTGSSISVHPSVPTTYMAVAVGCGDSSKAYINVLPVSSSAGGGTGASAPVHITNIIAPDTIECGSSTGVIRIMGVNPGMLDTIFYALNGVPQPYVVQTSGADSSLIVTGLPAGYYDYFFVKQGSCISNSVPVIINNSVLVANFTYTVAQGCAGDTIKLTDHSFNHGTATPPGVTGTYTSVFNMGDMTYDSSINPMHVYTAPNTYYVSLIYHNNFGCSDMMTVPVTLGHTVVSSFAPSAPAVCLGTPEVFNNTSTATVMPMTYSWTFGDGATSTDMNPTHTYAAPGTYSVTLTTYDAIPCPSISSTTVEVQSIEVRSDFHDTTVCLKIPMPIHTFTDVHASSPTTVSYLWTPATGLSDPTAAEPMFMSVGDYTLVLTATLNPLGCTASDVLVIQSKPPITLTNVTADATIPVGGSIQLNADSAWIYLWSPDNGTLSNPNINNPVATPTDSVTTYMVVGMSPYGCRDTAYVTVRVDQNVTEFIPQAFTPNGDGLNDLFRVFNIQYMKLVDFRIYNRWGHEVYHSIDPKGGWDGTYNGVPQDMGTYYYQVILATPEGETKSLSGSVTLIR